MFNRVHNLYQLDEDYTITHTALDGITFHNEWCSIEHGCITVHAGYSHDGCSPKWDMAGLGVLGVPDGRLHEGRPITYYPSLIHDVFCQFRDLIEISKEAVLQIWNDMLAEVEFGSRLLYVTAVDWLGPQEFAGDNFTARPEKEL